MEVPDWTKIWFLARSAASAAKSASRKVDMLAALFCTLFIRLEEVNSKRQNTFQILLNYWSTLKKNCGQRMLYLLKAHDPRRWNALLKQCFNVIQRLFS